MKGATADPWAKISSMVNKTITTIIGMSHHNLRFRRKAGNSPTMSRRVETRPCDCSDIFNFHKNERYAQKNSASRKVSNSSPSAPFFWLLYHQTLHLATTLIFTEQTRRQSGKSPDGIIVLLAARFIYDIITLR